MTMTSNVGLRSATSATIMLPLVVMCRTMSWATRILMSMVVGATSPNTERFGFQAWQSLGGPPIAMAIGSGLRRGATRGLTMSLGGLLPSTTDVGSRWAALGDGCLAGHKRLWA